MCRKTTGAAFATSVYISTGHFELISGQPTWRRSSAACQRGFCPSCGSALFMKYDADDEVAVSLGSLDNPHNLDPDSARLPWTISIDPASGSSLATLSNAIDHRRCLLRLREPPARRPLVLTSGVMRARPFGGLTGAPRAGECRSGRPSRRKNLRSAAGRAVGSCDAGRGPRARE
jgi:hypothetical protein